MTSPVPQPQQRPPEVTPEVADTLDHMARLHSPERVLDLLDRLGLRQGRIRAVLLDMEHERQGHRDAAFITVNALIIDMLDCIRAHLNNQPFPDAPRDLLKEIDEIADAMREGRW